MTVVGADLYQALRRSPFIGALMFLGSALAGGLALGWLITWSLPIPIFGPATVRCFSNGQLIYEGRSEGAVDRGCSGIAFRDAAGHRTRIRGDCVIIYD